MITLPADEYPENRVEITKKLHKEIQESGIYVKTVSEMHEHFVAVDREIVWYGSMNFLSREKDDDYLLRGYYSRSN